MTIRFPLVAVLVLLCGASATVSADPAPFDLAGPGLRIKITRDGQTLPVSEVPNLAAGDRLWIKADLPATQSARYVMVAAFLRGATNPPPAAWFFRCETWSRKCSNGLTLTVPEGAQQVLVFLAPQTGGDFSTLVDAVRGRPGAFVRASQDLNQASLDRSRLESYLLAVRSLNEADPARLRATAPLLARSLAIKVDDKCLEKIPELQAPCLMDGQESLILNDGHSTSIVEALTSGPASDLAMQASYTPQLSYGYYSPYIAAVMDIGRILSSFHTAQYQYLPALAAARGDRLSLTLNAPPSFYEPKSVLVTALPAVEDAQLPPLHAVDPQQIFCARKTSLVLPVEGAPLVFSTHYAHDVTLSLTGADGGTVDLPATADAQQGGFVVDTTSLGHASLGDHVSASLHGFWGFDSYQAPTFQLVNAHAQPWQLSAADADALVVGRESTVHLTAGSVSCVDSIMLKDSSGKSLSVEWKAVRADAVEIKVPLQEAAPGSVTLLVSQYGGGDAQPVQLHTFSEAGHLDSFVIHAGDGLGTLKGTRLDEVAGLSWKGVTFVPGTLVRAAGTEELPMLAQDLQAAAALQMGETARVRVTLKDGRTFDLDGVVDAPRPSVTLLGKNVQPSQTQLDSNISLSDQDQLPQDAQLTFSVRAVTPQTFDRTEQIEVATADDAFSSVLSVSGGTLMLADAKVAVATLDPSKAFGPSAFGPLRFRVISEGVTGSWQPLATLVRLPLLRSLECPATADLACRLSGTNLFLIDSVASDAQFHDPVRVPEGFPGNALPVPHPQGGQLYVRLRDDPAVINGATLIAQSLPQQPRALAAVRQAAAAETAAQFAASAARQAGAPQAVAPTPAAAPVLTPTPTPAGGPASGTAPAPAPVSPVSTAPAAAPRAASAPGPAASSPSG